MKKITSEKLSKKLVQYSALSVAIAGVADANGQIVYTDIADVTLDGVTTGYDLDLDNDASGDFLLRTNPSTGTPFAFMFPATGTVYNSNEIVGFSAAGYNYASNLVLGELISAASPLSPSGARADLNFNGCAYSSSQFCDGQDGYLGLKFLVSSNTHYGWARIQVSSDATTMIIKDYAYNSTPDEAIEAGQQALSLDDFNLNNTRIVALNNSIGLYGLPESAEFNVYDITGKLVLNGTTSNDTHVIEAQSFSNGIYIVELNSQSSSAVLRKKVVL